MNWEKWKQAAVQRGISDLQVDENGSRITSLRLFEGNVDSFTISDCRTWSIKGIYHGRMGSVVVESMKEDEIPFVLHALIENAEAITSEDVIELYPGEQEYPSLVYKENKCLRQPVFDKIALLKEVEDKLLHSDSRIAQVMEVSYRDYEGDVTLRNTRGLNASRHADVTMLSAEVLVKDGDDQKSAYDVAVLKSLDAFDVDRFVNDLKEEAVSKLHAKQILSGSYPTIIKGKAMANLLGCLIIQLNGEQVAKGISLLKDSLDRQIFDEKVSLIDDPFMEDGIQSTPFDDEGVACRRKELVAHGILQGYLHHLKSAKALHMEATGNGFGADISHTNLYLAQGDNTFTDMIRTMKNGVVISDVTGLHAGWNPITTQFSLQASGFYVKDGEIVHPLNLITIAGNFLELMKDITMIGNDLIHYPTGIGSPSVLFPSLAISGEGK